jgi:outer membrane PBP1 activator LpoA protein
VQHGARHAARRVVLLALAAGLVLAACTPSGNSNNAANTQRQTAKDAKQAEQAIQRAKTRDPGCQFLVARTEKRAVPAPAKDLLFLTDAVATAQPCYDKITFTFQSTGADLPPGYAVEYHKGQVIDGPDKKPAITLGNATLLVTFTPAQSDNRANPNNVQKTYAGLPRLALKHMHHTCIVNHLTDGDGTVNWLIGLDVKRPFTVDAYNNPPRVDVLVTAGPNDAANC